MHKGSTKGAIRVLEPPFQQEGGVWKIRENRPFRTKVKISHEKGRLHTVIGPNPLFNHTRCCGLGKHAKRALEGGGSCAHFLAKHPTAVTDFVRLRRMNLVLDDHKKEAGKGICPCHHV